MHWWDVVGVFAAIFGVLTWLLSIREKAATQTLKEQIERLKKDDRGKSFRTAVDLARRADDVLLEANNSVLRHSTDGDFALKQLVKIQTRVHGDLKALALYIASSYPAELLENIDRLGMRQESAILKELKIHHHALIMGELKTD